MFRLPLRPCAIAFFLAFTLLSAPAPASAAEAHGSGGERAVQEREILNLLRNDCADEALPLCRSYCRQYPGDAFMQYNLACLENGAGDPDAASAAFARAVAAGFEDFDHALQDPDLAGLDSVAAIVEEERTRLADLARQRGRVLTYGAWTSDLPLADRVLLPGGSETALSDPVLQLGWQPTGLAVKIDTDADWGDMGENDALSPANGGSGLFLSLAIPDGTSAVESGNHFLFSFGIEKGAGIGALFIPEQRRWQRVQELDPKIRIDEQGRYHLEAIIPWQAVMPYHPLVDTPLGVNAGLYLVDGSGPVMACLLQARDLLDPTAARRRFVPMDFDAATVPGEVFLGRVTHSISEGDPLGMDLVALSPEAGRATLTIDFLDGFGQSVMSTGPLSEMVDLAAGPNHFQRQADFHALETGSYMLKTDLAFPSGRTADWSTPILHLAPGWDDRLRSRIALLGPEEEPTATFYLDTVREAVARNPGRRSPKAIGKTLTELAALLDNAETSGSILPEKGVFLMVYPGPDGSRRLASLYLPATRDRAGKLNPVVILNPSPGGEGHIADRIGRNYEHGDLKPTLKSGDETGFPVYVVPRLESLDPGSAPEPVAEADACLDWALVTFGAETASVVGIDGTGGTALRLVLEESGRINNLLVFAGRNLEPWPQASAAVLAERLAPLGDAGPITWMDFEAETAAEGQGPDLLAALRAVGADLRDVQTVRGGLSLTQAADRTVRWAEEIR